MSTYERRGFLRKSFLSAAGLAASWPLNADFAKEGSGFVRPGTYAHFGCSRQAAH